MSDDGDDDDDLFDGVGTGGKGSQWEWTVQRVMIILRMMGGQKRYELACTGQDKVGQTTRDMTFLNSQKEFAEGNARLVARRHLTGKGGLYSKVIGQAMAIVDIRDADKGGFSAAHRAFNMKSLKVMHCLHLLPCAFYLMHFFLHLVPCLGASFALWLQRLPARQD